MKNYFYKINKKYIDAFSSNVLTRFANENIRSNVVFLRSIFKEINNLFQRIGGKLSSKRDIPKPYEYPDSKKFNRLISNIAFDIDKIYTSQKIIEDDVNNLINFNSTQRVRTFENLTTTQQEVYSSYIKNKGDLRGEITIPSENPFRSADNVSPESEGIYIDEGRGVLTLQYTTQVSKPVVLEGVRMFFAGAKPPIGTYPSQDYLGLGSHWKLKGKEVHHIDSDNKSIETQYKNMLIDDPNSNFGIGWCEFEGVQTNLNYIVDQEISIKNSYSLFGSIDISVNTYKSSDEIELKNKIGEMLLKDQEFIYLDVVNSLQGRYSVSTNNITGENTPQYKLVIPFSKDAPFTNQINITVQPDSKDFYPKLNWKQTKVFSNNNGSDVAYGLVSPVDLNKIPDNGEYLCIINGGFIRPSRMEVIFEYGADSEHWDQIEFMMGHWVYSASKNYLLPTLTAENVSIILGKSYDIFVDVEPDQEKEKQRAKNVLLARGK